MSQRDRTTIWQNCKQCGKEYFYDAAVSRCARCCRENREAKQNEER